MNNLSRLAFLLGSWADLLPALWRKRVYDGVKVLAGLTTVALLVLPYLPQVGLSLPTSVRWDALFTGALTLLGQLASRNTMTDPLVDVTPAPEVHHLDQQAGTQTGNTAAGTTTVTITTNPPNKIDPRTERPA